jgi:hypothetical protein
MKGVVLARGFLPGLPPRSTTPVTDVKERRQRDFTEGGPTRLGGGVSGRDLRQPATGQSRQAQRSGTPNRAPIRTPAGADPRDLPAGQARRVPVFCGCSSRASFPSCGGVTVRLCNGRRFPRPEDAAWRLPCAPGQQGIVCLRRCRPNIRLSRRHPPCLAPSGQIPRRPASPTGSASH